MVVNQTGPVTQLLDVLHDLPVGSHSRLPNGLGTQLRLRNGTVLDIYDRGAIVIGGRDTDAVTAVSSRHFRQKNSKTFVTAAPSGQSSLPGFGGEAR